jgi:lipopolysaccharide export system permease protein
MASGTWQSMIKPEMMNVLLISPDRMSIFDLNDFIKYLKKNNQKTSRYEVSFWEKIIQPLMPMIMILFSVPFGFFRSAQEENISNVSRNNFWYFLSNFEFII